MVLQLYRIWRDGERLELSYVGKLRGMLSVDASGLLYQRLLIAQVVLSFLWVSHRKMPAQIRAKSEEDILPSAAMRREITVLQQSQC